MIHFPVPTIIWCKSGHRIKNTELPEFGGWTPPTSEGRRLRRPRTTHDEPKALGNRSIQFSGILRLDFSVRTGWYLGVASDAPSERRAQLYGFAKHKVRARQNAQTAGHFRAKVCEPCHARPMIPRLTVRLFSDIHGDPVARTVSPYPDCRGAWLLLFGTLKGTSLGR
jgi:hypothetical protein